MKISEHAEEILESLWGRTQEGKKGSLDVSLSPVDPVIAELTGLGFIQWDRGKIDLTPKGIMAGEKVVRRHRLAERLFADVLDIQETLVHPVSCKFEHLLHGGIEDNICILLGHPTTCPHGRPIPPGECCRKQKNLANKIVSALSDMEAHQKGKVAYIHTKDRAKLQKLMAMHILPGLNIHVLQKYPSYVFQIGNSQFAVDRELAEAIFVRISRS